jgi:hypothetical protein
MKGQKLPQRSLGVDRAVGLHQGHGKVSTIVDIGRLGLHRITKVLRCLSWIAGVFKARPRELASAAFRGNAIRAFEALQNILDVGCR